MGVRRHPPDSVVDSFGGLAEQGIRPVSAYVSDLARIGNSVSDLGAPSYENALRLVKLGRELWRVLRLFIASSKLLLRDLPESERMARGRTVIGADAVRLCDELFSEYALSAPPLRADRRVLIQIFRELIHLGAKPNTIRVLFRSIFGDLRTTTLRIWEPWYETFKRFERKAERYAREYRGLESRATLFPASAAVKARKVGRAIPTILDRLCVGRPSIEELRRDLTPMRRRSPRSHRVWNPILKELEGNLRPFYRSRRNWEVAGGVPGGTAVPEELYRMINRILNFCYSGVWPYTPQITQNVKMRCHQSESK